jgi:hypothetical protein
VGSGLKGHCMTCPSTGGNVTRAPGIPTCVSFVFRMRKTHDAAGRPGKRSAQRRHGAEASGMDARRDETRCARLDA